MGWDSAVLILPCIRSNTGWGEGVSSHDKRNIFSFCCHIKNGCDSHSDSEHTGSFSSIKWCIHAASIKILTCLHLAPWLGTQALPQTIQYTLSGMDCLNATLSQPVREKEASNNVIFPYMSTVRGVL
jgi:hypothetical protein